MKYSSHKIVLVAFTRLHATKKYQLKTHSFILVAGAISKKRNIPHQQEKLAGQTWGHKPETASAAYLHNCICAAETLHVYLNTIRMCRKSGKGMVQNGIPVRSGPDLGQCHNAAHAAAHTPTCRCSCVNLRSSDPRNFASAFS